MDKGYMTCENHPTLRWSCKEIAINKDGRYNSMRNIFFMGATPKTDDWTWTPAAECSCPGSKLILVEKLNKVLRAAK